MLYILAGSIIGVSAVIATAIVLVRAMILECSDSGPGED